ncbi:MAG: hypothetical protein CG438_559 [Methylococcaceae bacterium NSP1-1]|jgi:hypothetical protein|nr:MAG: hypothetical protein CG438_559 [Methylococcaceae bacterium NSP1-1]
MLSEPDIRLDMGCLLVIADPNLAILPIDL